MSASGYGYAHPHSGGQPAPAAGKKPRRLRIWLTIGLVLILVLGISAEVGSRAWMANIIASSLQERLQMSHKPTIKVGGRLFLRQLPERELSNIRIRTDKATIAGVEVSDIDARLSGISMDRDFHPVTVRYLSADVAVSYASLSKKTSLQVGPSAQPDSISITSAVIVLGKSTDITCVARPVLDVDRRQMWVRCSKILVAGHELSRTFWGSITPALVERVPLGLPDGIEARYLSVTDAGLKISVEAHDLDLRR